MQFSTVSIFTTQNTTYLSNTLVTDDDGTTRSNVKHNYNDLVEQEHPGFMEGGTLLDEDTGQRYGGKIPSRLKRSLGWPLTKSGAVKAENPGMLPIYVPAISNLWSDIAHRIRAIAREIYKMKTDGKTKIPGAFLKGECAMLKRSLGFYCRKNRRFGKEYYCTHAKCVILHKFNRHELCHISWCKHVKNQRPWNRDGPLVEDDQRRYRSTNTPEEEKFFDKVCAKIFPLLSYAKMEQLFHWFQTQKNETLNEQACAICPKDKYLGGRMTLYDRLRMIVDY